MDSKSPVLIDLPESSTSHPATPFNRPSTMPNPSCYDEMTEEGQWVKEEEGLWIWEERTAKGKERERRPTMADPDRNPDLSDSASPALPLDMPGSTAAEGDCMPASGRIATAAGVNTLTSEHSPGTHSNATQRRRSIHSQHSHDVPPADLANQSPEASGEHDRTGDAVAKSLKRTCPFDEKYEESLSIARRNGKRGARRPKTNMQDCNPGRLERSPLPPPPREPGGHSENPSIPTLLDINGTARSLTIGPRDASTATHLATAGPPQRKTSIAASSLHNENQSPAQVQAEEENDTPDFRDARDVAALHKRLTVLAARVGAIESAETNTYALDQRKRDQEGHLLYTSDATNCSNSPTNVNTPDTAIPDDMVDGVEVGMLEPDSVRINNSADIVPRSSLEPPGGLGAAVSTTADFEGHIDESDEDADSAHGEGPWTPTTSLCPSIKKHEWKHGRRYHSYQSGAYWFPNDDIEQDRLDLLHQVIVLALDGSLSLAPIKRNLDRILDVGTGTGKWAMEAADQYPCAYIKGIDLSPIQPEFVPPNLEFIVDDVEQDWDEPARYDYIHCRNLSGSIIDWQRLFCQMFKSLKPGGWIEIQGFVPQPYSLDKPLSPDNPLAQLMDGLREAGKKCGRSMEPALSFKHWAQSTAFVEVKERRFEVPIGIWPTEERLRAMGSLMAASLFSGVGGITAVPFRDILRWSREEVEALNANVRQMVTRPDVHANLDFVVVTGMKPRQ